jgi:PilZ domain-containing protein
MRKGLSTNQMEETAAAEYPQSRASSRIRIQVPVFLKGTDAAGVEFVELTRTLNISARGACITSTHHLRVDQPVQLTIPAPAPASSSLVPSETPPISARVRRQGVLGDLRIFGLEFMRPLD